MIDFVFYMRVNQNCVSSKYLAHFKPVSRKLPSTKWPFWYNLTSSVACHTQKRTWVHIIVWKTALQRCLSNKMFEYPHILNTHTNLGFEWVHIIFTTLRHWRTIQDYHIFVWFRIKDNLGKKRKLSLTCSNFRSRARVLFCILSLILC